MLHAHQPILTFSAFIVLMVSGCASLGTYGVDPRSSAVPDAEIVVRQPELYTRSEVDALNAEIACRSLARNSLQASRCGIRR